MKRLLVIGGGLAGLSAAWHAQRAGVEVRLLEISEKIGGVVQTIYENGYLAESGPNSMLVSTPATAKLLHDLSLENEIVETSPAAKKRFVVRNGVLVPVPISPWQFLMTPLLSLRGKLRLLREPWASARAAGASGEESLADFARRRLGPEALTYALDPFVAGVYAGNPEKLSTRQAFPRLHALEEKHRSLARAAWTIARERKAAGSTKPESRSISFRSGMAALPRALAQKLGKAITLQAQLTSLQRLPDGTWGASWKTPAAQLSERFDAVVLAVPAPKIAGLLIAPALLSKLASLAKIEHPPVTVVTLGYARAAVGHPLDGFGVLVPVVEPFEVLGVLFTSSLFPERAPAGHVILTAFIGGARHPELAALPDPDLLALATRNLEKLLTIRGTPTYQRIVRWPHAIPQYDLDYSDKLAAIEAAEQKFPGLALAGSYCGGVSVAQCVEAGQAAALRALNLSPSAAE